MRKTRVGRVRYEGWGMCEGGRARMTFKHIIVRQELDLSEHVTMAAGCCNIWIEQAIMSTHTMYTHTHTHAYTHTHTYTHTAYAMHTATIRKELENPPYSPSATNQSHSLAR